MQLRRVVAPGLPPRAAGRAPTPQAGRLEARRPAPAHPRLGLAGHAVIQRRHVRAAAPSLLPPPSPRAWQEKRATWSGNKGPRGPRRSGTRCHPTPGPRRPCGPRPAPRPHGPREETPGARAPRGTSSSPPEGGGGGGGGSERPPPGPGRRSAPRTGSLAGRTIPRRGLRSRPPPPPPSIRDLRILPGSSLKRWKNSCLELRWGAGGSGRESAPRKAPGGRGGGERARGKTSGRSAEAAGRGPRRRGLAGTRSLARSLALPRRGSRRRDCAEQLWATDLHARPGDTAAAAAAAARCRRTPSHVTTCAAAVAAAEASRRLPARTRRPITREHEKAPARGPAPRGRPRPPPSPSWLPSCAAQLGQGKKIVLNEKSFLGRGSPPAGGGLNRLSKPKGSIELWEMKFSVVKLTHCETTTPHCNNYHPPASLISSVPPLASCYPSILGKENPRHHIILSTNHAVL
ncbi:unnamed protein product [Nyctereutes procyonoides]|uniref:(raccoon dog) hypothetical protein n=1 Tax=Nyctereutes procyonoides TaxID=34880 RepID=A0A811Y638_NYCPR|nr:unnamed protein product [Nyctereutes procyonoides]